MNFTVDEQEGPEFLSSEPADPDFETPDPEVILEENSTADEL